MLVLGIACKGDIDDLRELPALTVIENLQELGAELSYNAKNFPIVGRGRPYNLNKQCAPLEGLNGYDCVVIVTDKSDQD